MPLHERVREQLYALRSSERIILLSAPRAGHGKTHLLGRVAAMMLDEAVVASLPWQTRDGATWSGTGCGIIEDLARANQLQAVCGGVNAMLLRRLIQTGRIPSNDPAQALRVLGQNPMELFSPEGSARVIGGWFRKHFDQLCRPLAQISNLDSLSHAEAWLRAMFEYVGKPDAESQAVLMALAAQDASQQVPRFLRLAAVYKPLVLLADHMDAFYRDPASGVALAQFALALAALPGVHVVLSMNQDLWETSFGSQLPSALEDRLNSQGVALRGLNVAEAGALVSLRLADAGVPDDARVAFLRFLDLDRYFLGRPVGSVSARALLRHAGAQWRLFVQAGALAPPSVEGAVPGGAPGAMPVFDEHTDAELRQLAQSLAAEAGGQKVDIAHGPAAPVPPPPPVSAPGESEIPPESFLPDERPPAGERGPAPSRTGSPAAPAVGGEEQRSNFQRLRQMLAKLRVATDAVPPVSGASTAPRLEEPPPAARPEGQDLKARYEELWRDLAQEGAALRMDCEALGALVRMAGRRFPVVRYDEVELPGLSGRSLPRWSLQGMEIVFGIEDFADQRFWKTVSSFVAGRVAELGALAAQAAEVAPQLKLVIFKGETEGAALEALLREDVIPAGVRSHVDLVHLDPRSLGQLHAMRRVIREAESGSLPSAPGAVLVALADELSFFWKRITRPRGP